MEKLLLAIVISCSIGLGTAAQSRLDNADQIVDKITDRERALVKDLDNYMPVAETYIQEFAVKGEEAKVVRDHYFLSLAKLGPDVDILAFKGTPKDKPVANFLGTWVAQAMEYLPEGFANMGHPNVENLDRYHYRFAYAGRERLGEVDCLVFDLSPLTKSVGMFTGRIWVEDRDYTIIHYQGDFLGGNDMRGHYFHFDSSRMNAGPGLWLPATIYTEENEYGYNKILPGVSLAHARFSAQTRFWGYGPRRLSGGEQPSQTTAQETARPPHQLNSLIAASETMTAYNSERRIEDGVIGQLERVRLLAPQGAPDDALKAVVSKLEIANHLHIRPEVRCRELLTSRLELFTVGHTIVISRGLLNVLPNEATLAAVLALGLARVQLDIPLRTKHALGNFDPEETFLKMNFASPPNFRKAIRDLASRFMTESPYKDSLGLVHAFFAEVGNNSSHLSELFTANLGDSLGRMMYSEPEDATKENAGAHHALALGSRTKIDPWTDDIEVSEITEAGASPNRMPFASAPFVLAPKRQKTAAPGAANPSVAKRN